GIGTSVFRRPDSGRLDELALLDRIALGQRAVLEHPDRAALATRLAHAALRLGFLRHPRIVPLGLPNLIVLNACPPGPCVPLGSVTLLRARHFPAGPSDDSQSRGSLTVQRA